MTRLTAVRSTALHPAALRPTALRPFPPLGQLLARGVLALLLVFGQQQAALHWLGHAIDATHVKDGAPLASDHCDDCISLAAFGAAATSEQALPPVPSQRAALAPFAPTGAAPAALRLAFRSRAPPVLF